LNFAIKNLLIIRNDRWRGISLFFWSCEDRAHKGLGWRSWTRLHAIESANSLYKDFSFSIHSSFSFIFKFSYSTHTWDWDLAMNDPMQSTKKSHHRFNVRECVSRNCLRQDSLVWLEWEWEIIIEKNKHDKLAKLYEFFLYCFKDFEMPK
jgi:hypothetical protein